MKTLKELMDEKKSVFGIFAKTNDPMFVEIMGRAGMDFVIIDCEHGPNSPREVLPLVLAANASNLQAVVRVGSSSVIEIQRMLDLGISGVQVPQVQTEEDARGVVKSAKFAPLGRRGVCCNVRAADYSLKKRQEYFSGQNKDVAVIVHIEGVEGFRNLPSLMDVEGIDVFFIGPNDLAQSLGCPDVNHRKVQDAVNEIIAKCRKKGKHVGIYADNVQSAVQYKAMGVNYVACSTDVGIFARACADMANAFKCST
ncbi:MAG: aldolase/citrate lyase family protein [Victivallales bacterium]